MVEKAQNEIQERDNLVEFLVEDMKDTGEYLRETDRKIALLIQIYTGGFVLIATLSVNNVMDRVDFLGIPGLLLTVAFAAFTLWLFVYALKSKETKVLYIHRMNFLRREVHFLLQNKNKDLPGYWTASELTDITKKMLSSMSPEDKIKPKKVGLDDLYPTAFKVMLVLSSFAFAFLLSKNVCGYEVVNVNIFIKLLPFMIAVFVVMITILFIYTNKLSKDNEKSINYQIMAYKLSSEAREREVENQNNLTKKRSKPRKQKSKHD